jgi:D-psicose/D-tagatose/L-ribulose 3-epimerase
LFHCHAVDSNRLAPGEGHAPWDLIARELHGIDYDGALAIETFDPTNEVLSPLAAFWRPLPRPQDDMIRDGLAFLRREVVQA